MLRVGPPGDAPDCGGRAARDVVVNLVELVVIGILILFKVDLLEVVLL